MAANLNPLQLTAVSGLLENQAFDSAILNTAVNAYLNTTVIHPLANAVTIGSTGNILSNVTLTRLVEIASNSCPALSDSIPTANISSYPAELTTTLLTNTANTYLGNGDDSIFVQAFGIATGYASSTNQVINSVVNSQTYLGNTFTTMNDMVSGGITAVNLATPQWASDLAKLGSLINLKTLDDMGSPLALVKQLVLLAGVLPQISRTFSEAGVSTDVVVNLGKPSLTVTDADQRAMYTAMTKITGSELAQILQVFGVTTANINTMADLLNPYKIFPNSYQTLTVTNLNKVSVNIYVNDQGTVNADLAQGLPAVALYSIV